MWSVESNKVNGETGGPSQFQGFVPPPSSPTASVVNPASGSPGVAVSVSPWPTWRPVASTTTVGIMIENAHPPGDLLELVLLELVGLRFERLHDLREFILRELESELLANELRNLLEVPLAGCASHLHNPGKFNGVVS